ncbi:protein HEG homolog 1-like [Actinia tenebrosa]|uniref:Protein HEG homolog 1-like n=1 Tax=Actinia tenebrosa TaxID=6105 RepID=A0A6P8ITF2_ACTTE|nr:protein HEG homolog 1-like [Actinia tenebrosa]
MSQNPCEGKPCLNKGKCLLHKNRRDYRCRCKKGYSGEKCQLDVNECETKPCDANAACINTKGSYQCTCNSGYHGNGKQCSPYARGLDSSAILSNYGNATFLQDLGLYLFPVVQNPSKSLWVRCWHAANDGWNVRTTFHPQCDGNSPTVTIVRVVSYVFGGYSDVPWQSSGGYTSSSKSFLYSLRNIYGYSPVNLTLNGQNDGKAIYNGAGYGPVFGGGNDLFISDFASSYNDSLTSLGNTYRTHQICSSRGTCTSFMAGNDNFSPNDIEVFYETIT